jgi:hypothetical protein
MKKLFLITLASIILNFNLYSQNKNDELINDISLLSGIISQIEKNKELIENIGSNYIIKNYPNFKQFRLKVMGIGSDISKFSDDGDMNVIPLEFTLLENGIVTKDRRVLFLLIDNNKINNFGLKYSNFKFYLVDKLKWNKLLKVSSYLASPIENITDDFLIPIYLKTKQKNIDSDFIKFGMPEVYYAKSKLFDFEHLDIRQLDYTKNGLVYLDEIIFPFYKLEDDDYLTTNFDTEITLIYNEKSLGFFIKDFDQSVIIKRNYVNKIHRFLNSRIFTY